MSICNCTGMCKFFPFICNEVVTLQVTNTTPYTSIPDTLGGWNGPLKTENVNKLELIKLSQNINALENSIENLYDGIEKNFERIEKLEKKEVHICISHYSEIMEEINKLKKLISVDKKPYRCPVCDGTTIVDTKTGYEVCNACDGDGIVWG